MLAVEGGQYCEEHQRLAAQQYNKYTRSPDTNKKYGRGWKRIRDRYAAAHPLCEQCLKEGRLTPVEEVHHILPISQGGDHRGSNLMSLCQEALNPSGDGLRRSGYVFRCGDKVMQIKNNYDKEVFNGDIGMIQSVSIQDRELAVNFDGRLVKYDVTELDELLHAYATTVHKSQGSEYPAVVMPVLLSHFAMLQRNLIYTGITRAKKLLVMVGDRKALAYAVGNVTVTKRNTLLKERLSGVRDSRV